ncbi:MAG: hypothetical protein H6719_29400 [Sandaracinaceae bacterium]|nr:hypothetical protein [Sandaracinaceae bacterium]
MKLTCPTCLAPLAASDVNMEQLVGRCVPCDDLFSIADQVRGGKAAPRRRPGLPSGIRIERGEPPLPPADGYREAAPREAPAGDLLLRRRWFSFQHIFLLFFCIAWDAFIVFWYTGVTSGPAPWIFYVFPIAHVAVGVGLTYRTLAGLLNTTRIAITGGVLTVRHGPIPWLGNRELPVHTLRQLYVRRKTSRTKNGGQSTRWSVHAETDDRVDLQLLSGLESEEQARYVEWVIEDHLGIVDRPDMGD